MCTCVHACVYVGAGVCCSPGIIWLILNSVSLSWNMPSKLGWLASEPQRPACLLFNTQLHHTQLFFFLTWILRTKLKFSRLQDKPSPSPQPWLYLLTWESKVRDQERGAKACLTAVPAAAQWAPQARQPLAPVTCYCSDQRVRAGSPCLVPISHVGLESNGHSAGLFLQGHGRQMSSSVRWAEELQRQC